MKHLIVVILFFICRVFASGQRDHFFQQFTQREGLSNSSINDITLDLQGYIWIATDDGLNRFDGHRFDVFRKDPSDNNSPEGNHFNAICIDTSGAIWCAGFGWRTLSRRDSKTGSFSRISLTEKNELFDIHDIFCDATGQIWVNASTTIFRVDPETREVTNLSDITDPKKKPKSCNAYYGNVFSEDPSGKGFWLITKGGANYYDYSTGEFLNQNNPGKFSRLFEIRDCRTAIADAQGTLWLGSRMGDDYWHWLGYDPASDSIVFNTSDIRLDDKVQYNNFIAMHLSPDGQIWLGNNARTPLIWDIGRREFDYSLARKYPGSLKNHTLKTVLFDNNKNIWVGTEDGLYAEYADYQNAEVFWIGEYDDFQTPRIKCMYEWTDDDMLLAANKQIWHWNRQKRQTTPYNVVINGTDIKEDTRYIGYKSASSVWIATFFGLYSLDLQTFRFKNEMEALPEDWQKLFKINSFIIHVFSDKEGYTYVCTDKGLFVFNHEKKFYRHHDSVEGVTVPRMRITSFSTRQQGGYWWVDDRGRNVLYTESAEGELKASSFNNSLPVAPTTICEHPDGTLWLGSLSSGIACWQPGTGAWKQFDINDGLHSNCIYRILANQEGRIFVITSTGIDRYEPKIDRFRRMFSEFSLPSYFYRHVGLIAADGRIWSFSQNIFYSIPPTVNETLTTQSTVHINSMVVNNRSLPLISADESYQLGPDENSLRISFSALNLNPNAKTRYEYLLSGSETQWQSTNNEAQLSFNNLAPGSYILQIRSDFGTGIFSGTPCIIRFIIHPPWYQRPWFYAAVVLALLVITFLIIRNYYRKKIHLREEEFLRLRLVETERLRIARDMHDDLGGGLSSIRMMSEQAKNIHDTATLSDISKLSVDLVDNMRQIVWALSNENDTVEETCYYLMNYGRAFLRPSGIQGEFGKVIRSARKLTSMQRRNLFLVFKESLTNAVRYSGATKISLDFALESDTFSIRISDNGKGMNPSSDPKGPGGNGIRNMKQRIHDLNGRIHFENKDGLTISILIPLTDNKS